MNRTRNLRPWNKLSCLTLTMLRKVLERTFHLKFTSEIGRGRLGNLVLSQRYIELQLSSKQCQ